jgi:hypothetical protein
MRRPTAGTKDWLAALTATFSTPENLATDVQFRQHDSIDNPIEQGAGMRQGPGRSHF